MSFGIWVNPTRVTTATVPNHFGTGEALNKARAAGTVPVLTTVLTVISSNEDNSA